MKRILPFLLVCLILCGCSAAPAAGNTSGKDNPDAETTQPTTVTVPNAEDYPEDTGLAVKFEMGAEFEMVLDMYHAVLTVTPLNEAGEGLLSAIDPTGSYRNAVEIILEEAIRQEVLKRGMVINLAACEVGNGAWTAADHCILTWPIENYQQNCGMYFTCKLTPAGDCYDADSYRETFTRDYGDYSSTICYRKDIHEMTYAKYVDGSYSESYYPGEEDFMGCTYYADGRFEFFHNSPLSNEHYTLLPDGFAWGYSETLDEEGNTTRYTSLYEDGSYSDDRYENGIAISMLYITSDGIRQESTYYENGQPKRVANIVVSVQHAAETVKACSGDLVKAQSLLGGKQTGDTLTVDCEEGLLTIALLPTEHAYLGSAHITMTDIAGDELFSVTTAWQTGGGA